MCVCVCLVHGNADVHERPAAVPDRRAQPLVRAVPGRAHRRHAARRPLGHERDGATHGQRAHSNQRLGVALLRAQALEGGQQPAAVVLPAALDRGRPRRPRAVRGRERDAAQLCAHPVSPQSARRRALHVRSAHSPAAQDLPGLCGRASLGSERRPPGAVRHAHGHALAQHTRVQRARQRQVGRGSARHTRRHADHTLQVRARRARRHTRGHVELPVEHHGRDAGQLSPLPGRARRPQRLPQLHAVQEGRDHTQHDGSARQRGRGARAPQSTVPRRVRRHLSHATLQRQRRHRDRLQLGGRARASHVGRRGGVARQPNRIRPTGRQ